MVTGSLNLEQVHAISTLLSQKRSVDLVLDTIVRSLVNQSDAALARVWLIGPGDSCEDCPMASECPDQTQCLHLAASEHRQTHAESGSDWHSMDGFYRRIPLGIRRIGRIGKDLESFHLMNVTDDEDWIAKNDWLQKEGVTSFAGHPLIFDNEALGVLAVFARSEISEQEFSWLQILADHAAVAIANARAFEQIADLKNRLELENAYLRDAVDSEGEFGDIIGRSEPMKVVKQQVELVAPTDAAVLITGESGTGKELIAREVHRLSDRCNGPLIRVNCAAIPKELYESEFFGHAKGAFSGAVNDRAGRFEAADQGTLFLDEVGEIPLELQSKLLRVLQEGTYERVGESQTRKTDVRIIAATNRNLEAEVSAGSFRQDLYYRLNVFPLKLPALRERLDDIALLADHLLAAICRKSNRPKPKLAKGHVQTLMAYGWPGNVRELQNVIERAFIVGGGIRLEFDLARDLEQDRQTLSGSAKTNERIMTERQLRQLEKDNIVAALEQTEWRIYGEDGAAKLLGINPTTLASRLKKHGIERSFRR